MGEELARSKATRPLCEIEQEKMTKDKTPEEREGLLGSLQRMGWHVVGKAKIQNLGNEEELTRTR